MDEFTRFHQRCCVLVIFILAFTVACAPTSDEETVTNSSQKNAAVIETEAAAGPIQYGTVSSAVILDGSSSTGTNIIYHWSFRSTPPGSQVRLAGFETARPYFFPDRAGTYVLQLIVMDTGDGTSKDFVTVNVGDRPDSTASNPIADNHQGLTLSCVACHDGTHAVGKPAVHIAATDECAVCHGTTAWLPNIAIDHNEILGTCSYCHNGIRAPGKPADHIVTTAECVECHTAGTTFSLIYTSGLLFTTLDDRDDDSSNGSEHPPIGNAMCVDCHNNMIEEGKPDDHIPSSDTCDNCHTTDDWDIASSGAGGSDHPPIGNAMCVDCHNNEIEEGKPADHIPASDNCESCHSVDDWDIAGSDSDGSDDHPPIGSAMCVDCHNNVIEEGKPADHIPASDNCVNCHTTSDWDISGSGSSGDSHPPIGDMMCVDCHNNDIQEGKPDDHIPASDTCENCHVTSDWEDVAGSGGSGDDEGDDSGGGSDHPPIGNAMCFDCHNNVVEEGKEDDHILTTNICEACHTTNDWDRVISVDHVQVIGVCSSCHNKPQGHVVTSQECNACHSTTSW